MFAWRTLSFQTVVFILTLAATYIDLKENANGTSPPVPPGTHETIARVEIRTSVPGSTDLLHGEVATSSLWCASVLSDGLQTRRGILQWLGIPNHCSWSAHCAASLSLPSRSPSSPLPSMSSPSSSTVASVGLSSFSIFCMPSKDFWSFGSRLKKIRTHKPAVKILLCFVDTSWKCSCSQVTDKLWLP